MIFWSINDCDTFRFHSKADAVGSYVDDNWDRTEHVPMVVYKGTTYTQKEMVKTIANLVKDEIPILLDSAGLDFEEIIPTMTDEEAAKVARALAPYIKRFPAVPFKRVEEVKLTPKDWKAEGVIVDSEGMVLRWVEEET